MLYDNGQLATVYALAYEQAPREDFKRVVDETLEFLLREMLDASGAFYAALDAETDGEEGRYYVWEKKEIEQVLGGEELALAAEVYGVAGEPNFEGRFILLLDKPLADTAQARGLSESALDAKLQPIRGKLLAERSKRPRPLTDTKILTGWNALAIRGLADAGRVFKNDRYTAAAARAADFILANVRDSQGRLQRTFAAGKAKVPAYLDDYAFLVDGLIALHRASGDDRWLRAAGELTDAQIELFWDEPVGGFFYTSTLHEKLIARSKLSTDNVTPSGNSVSAANLVVLAVALDKPEYLARAEKCIQSAGPILDEHPAAVTQMAVALAEWLEVTSKSSAKNAPKK
jgi:hypothetical protein